MAKLSKILFLCLLISSHSLISRADEPRAKIQTTFKQILEFEEFPTSLLINGELFFGLLISEPTYDKIILDKIELSKLRKQILIYENYDIKLEDNFSRYNKITSEKIDEITQIINKPRYESFWDSNKTWIMFATGIVLGAVIYKVIDK